MFNKSNYHCDYCNTPKELWEPLKTFKSDRSCELYSDFFDIIWGLEEKKKYSTKDIYSQFNKIKHKYKELLDFHSTFNELIEIGIDIGIISKLEEKANCNISSLNLLL